MDANGNNSSFTQQLGNDTFMFWSPEDPFKPTPTPRPDPFQSALANEAALKMANKKPVSPVTRTDHSKVPPPTGTKKPTPASPISDTSKKYL